MQFTAKHVNIKKILDFAKKFVIFSSTKRNLYSVTFIGHAYSFNWINTIDDVVLARITKSKEKKKERSLRTIVISANLLYA